MGLTRHDGLAVYGSGLYYCPKANVGVSGADVPFFGGTGTGTVVGGVRCDGGLIGLSGKLLSVSTRLSSIYAIVATINTSNSTSGPTGVNVPFSGNAFDMVLLFTTGSGTGACGVSSMVSWIATGV